MKKNDLEVNNIVEDLRSYDGYFPRKTIQAAIDLGERIHPALLRVVEQTVVDAKQIEIKDGDWQAFIVAVNILSKFRVKETFPHLIALCRLPSDTIDALLADDVTEGFSRYLASTFNGDFESLHQIALDDTIDEYVRGAAIKVFLILYCHDVISRDEIIEYFSVFFRQLEKDDSHAKATLVYCCNDIHATELVEKIRESFKKGTVDEDMVDLHTIEQCFLKDRTEVLESLKKDKSSQMIDDPIAGIEWWVCWNDNQLKYSKLLGENEDLFADDFDEDEDLVAEAILEDLKGFQTPTNQIYKGVGRNEPCICGSGKKYKKCCLLIVGIESSLSPIKMPLINASPYTPCSCGSGKKYKFCCKDKSLDISM